MQDDVDITSYTRLCIEHTSSCVSRTYYIFTRNCDKKHQHKLLSLLKLTLTHLRMIYYLNILHWLLYLSIYVKRMVQLHLDEANNKK
jgi:hypothetical protein